MGQFIMPRQETAPYNLNRMKKLMEYLNDPQDKLKIIHIAGTSGKTSTAYYLASLLQQCGFKVGLTVSPPINEVSDRAQVDLVPLPKEEYLLLLGQFLDIVNGSGQSPSYFEVLNAFSFWLFYKKRVDYAVIEVGVGGLLDCTNVVSSTDKICVITDIGFDHTKLLGKTIHEITLQKAGIIQPINFVFMNAQNDEVTDLIKDSCLKKNASFHIAKSDRLTDDIITTLPLFQSRNFQLAVTVINYVINRDNISGLTMGMLKLASSTNIPARMEIVSFRGIKLILDGSHNNQKIGALVESVRQRFPDESITILVAFGYGKQSSSLAKLRLLRTLSSKIIISSFDDFLGTPKHSANPQIVAEHAKEAGFTSVIVEPDSLKALKILEETTRNVGLVTGSFYILGKIRLAVLI